VTLVLVGTLEIGDSQKIGLYYNPVSNDTMLSSEYRIYPYKCHSGSKLFVMATVPEEVPTRHNF
jgi:hypothetical protein